jgi:hypothetical protein
MANTNTRSSVPVSIGCILSVTVLAGGCIEENPYFGRTRSDVMSTGADSGTSGPQTQGSDPSATSESTGGEATTIGPLPDQEESSSTDESSSSSSGSSSDSSGAVDTTNTASGG